MPFAPINVSACALKLPPSQKSLYLHINLCKNYSFTGYLYWLFPNSTPKTHQIYFFIAFKKTFILDLSKTEFFLNINSVEILMANETSKVFNPSEKL